MAMPVSSVFTGPERRKKLVTYGRAARLSNAQLFTDDPPSPERPRKQVGRLNSASQKPGAASGAKDALDDVRVRKQSLGLYGQFDIPSDSEPRPRTAIKKPLQNPPPKPSDDFDVFDVPSSGDERKVTKAGRAKAAQQQRGKINVARSKVPAQQATASDKKQVVAVSSDDPLITATPAVRTRSRTPAADTRPTATAAAKAAKQNALAFKVNARATIAPKTAPKQTKAKLAPAPLVTGTAPTPLNDDMAVFDVPPSDDEVLTQKSARPRKAPIIRAKVPSKPSRSRTSLSPEPSAESDTSNASNKRKRSGSASSSMTVKKINNAQRKREASVPIQRKREPSISIQRKREASVAPRSRKHQKTDDSLSPGQSANEALRPNRAAVAHDAPSDKLKCTRIRNVPVISRPAIAKAQSSPVKLHSMLAMRSGTIPSRVQETLEAPVVEDETMYEIPDEATPRAQDVKSTIPGSVTPRQRDLFSNLLEDGSDLTTPMPSISKLRITEQTPGSAFATLARSSSDIPQSTHTRKGRLIDLLKQQRAPSFNEDSESDEESEADVTKILNVPAAAQSKANRHVDAQELAEVMEIDPDTATSSQTSRAPVPIVDRSRTYAQQRSYLEETSLEDGLLNWDDDIEVDLPTRQGSVTESEDDSQQVTGLTELRRKGQLYKFEAETQAIIEDISGNTNTNISARRSAMMEFATQLADVSYVNQLLESAMTSSLLRAISATGDIVFDFGAAAAIVFILRTKPSYAVVEQVYQSEILITLRKLLSSPMLSLDIHRISKDRKTNMSSSARDSVAEFRTLILRLLDWPEADVPKLSPQLLSVKVLEELVLGLRIAGNTDAIVDDGMISKVLDVATGPAQRLQSGKATRQDDLILETAFSTLESLSISKDGQATWPEEVLRRLVNMMPAFFDTTISSPRRLVIRLCMNLANGRPKVCQIFADQTFVTRLARFIVVCFNTLEEDASQQPLTQVRDDLILGLGAMMNLAEFSDAARLNVAQGGDELIGDLVNIFLEGSERAERADSVKDVHALVPTGYLTIMLGNLCLNDQVRRKVMSLLPGKKMTLLVQKVREFVQYNQRLDQVEFEGAEGQQTLQNFTLRLMLVVERLEKAGGRESAGFSV
ncbi:hypothetical protein SLS60_003141 [Paraconiothyrium brasiliense]|uniref:Wings apart-like protein C-terminal domain-containing protein n=1 Tax=Paraconiothyrium brasiliense TaxID=300254 RepID=A0ABR3RW60_9PLEO